MASTSSPYSSRKWTYDVFINFNGSDTRLNFVDHLYSALHDRSIYTFKDDQKLQRGKSISSELVQAIERSKFAIVIFSRNYASSSWCLDELVKIIECKNLLNLTVLPVFYDVDPSEVRKQTGSFLEKYRESSSSYKDKWGKALFDAAGISGWDVRKTENGHEARCIKEIVGYIWKNLGHATSWINAENLVGIQWRVDNVKSLLHLGTDDSTRIIGVWGMGGIGKTTDEVSCHFEVRSFVANVREASRTKGLQSLQEQILHDILGEKDLKVRDIHEGAIMMSDIFYKFRVLLVLDDVDHVNQLIALAGKRDCFGLGSRIIITTRDKQLLDFHGVNDIHRVIQLNYEESLHLFSRYAFKRGSPPDRYLEPSRLVVRNVGGLPLALNVLGSFLCGRDVIEWTSALDRLKDIPENDILDVLKISYDGLKSIEKELFLDIACFFVGTSKDVAIQILDSFDFHPVIGISVLVQKSLLIVSNGKLEMHDLIQEMGWHIVRQFYPKEPGKYTRLWRTEDVVNVLTKNTGTEVIQGIKLDWSCGVQCKNTAFCNMKKLRLLYVDSLLYNMHSQKLEYLSNELRWIYWPGCPFDSLPDSFQPENLVHLEMPRSQIVHLWTREKAMNKLKFVDLSNSYALTSTPDFSGAPNLERLILKRCANLAAVHHSVGDLTSLVLLDLTDCRELKSFPPSIKTMSLQTLVLTGCSKLADFPRVLVNIESLTRLSLKDTAIKELHSSIQNLTGILFLDLSYCPNFATLPNSICGLKRLRSLLLFGCQKFEELPENFEQLESLEELELGNTGIRQPPPSIGLLKNLKKLSFTGSKPIVKSQLQPKSSFFCSVTKKEIRVSVELELPSLSGCLFLRQLDLSYCDLFEIPVDLRLLASLEELNLSGNYFSYLPDRSICQLSQLKILILDDCRNLEELPGVPLSIEVLVADQCISLKGLVNLSLEHRCLWKVSFVNCFEQDIVEKIAGLLLQTLLQGYAVIDHRFSIVLPGRKIPNSFSHQGEGKFPILQLPQNWQNKILGFAFCLVLEKSYPPPHGDGCIRLRSKYDEVTAYFKCYNVSENMFERERDHIWMGYFSLDSIFRKYVENEHHNIDAWFKIGEVKLSILHEQELGKCGLCLVHKKDEQYSQSMINYSYDQARSYENMHLNHDLDMHLTSVLRAGDFT